MDTVTGSASALPCPAELGGVRAKGEDPHL